jgi:hypothetical protein
MREREKEKGRRGKGEKSERKEAMGGGFTNILFPLSTPLSNRSAARFPLAKRITAENTKAIARTKKR